jgi:hypothetical protein
MFRVSQLTKDANRLLTPSSPGGPTTQSIDLYRLFAFQSK